MNRFRMMLILLTLCFATTSMAASPPIVRYDGRSDLLTVQARQVSLLQLLAEISFQTGVEILMDPAAEKSVTVDFEKKTLEDGLRQLTRLHNLNTALSYADPKSGSQRQTPLVIAMKVLPQGKTSSRNLLPVLTGRKEIAARTADAAASKENIRTLQLQRWEERKAQLSEKERQELEVKEQQFQAEKAKDKVKQDKAKEVREKKKAEREERRKQREEIQKQKDPVGYQRRVEEREKNRQYYIDEFKRQQPTQPAGE